MGSLRYKIPFPRGFPSSEDAHRPTNMWLQLVHVHVAWIFMYGNLVIKTEDTDQAALADTCMFFFVSRAYIKQICSMCGSYLNLW